MSVEPAPPRALNRRVQGLALAALGLLLALLALHLGEAPRRELQLGALLLLAALVYALTEARVALTRATLGARHAELAQAHAQLAQAHAQLDEAHARARDQERLSSLGLLAAGIAHEINNPLAFVKSNVHSLSYDLQSLRALPAELQEYVDDVLPATLDGIQRIVSIVGDLRRFARLDAEQMVEYDLNDEARAALRISRSHLHGRCEVAVELGELPRLTGWPRQMAQVLVNLLVNAAQAMPTRGKVTLRTWLEEGHAHVSVQDTGTGMSAQVQARLFEPFFTTKPVGEGTGMGLAVVHGIVSAHGGSVAVQSTLGQGTTFTLRLPCERPVLALEPEQLRALAHVAPGVVAAPRRP